MSKPAPSRAFCTFGPGLHGLEPAQQSHAVIEMNHRVADPEQSVARQRPRGSHRRFGLPGSTAEQVCYGNDCNRCRLVDKASLEIELEIDDAAARSATDLSPIPRLDFRGRPADQAVGAPPQMAQEIVAACRHDHASSAFELPPDNCG